MDEMRDRLIAALKTAKDEIIDLDLKGLADKLIAAGAKLLPIVQEVTTSNFSEELNTFDGNSSFWEHVYLVDGKVAIDIHMTEAEARAALLENTEN